MEAARRLLEQGLPLAAVAAQVHATPEQIQNWLREAEADEDELLAIYQDRFATHCARCGELIPPGTNYADVGGVPYHHGCRQR